MKITTNALFNKLTDALTAKLPFVMYRYPNTKKVKGVFQKTDALFKTVNYLDSGFIFAPFDNAEPSIFFPIVNSDRYSAILSEKDLVAIPITEKGKSNTEISKEKHMELVQKSIDFLNVNAAKKVVISRKEKIDMPNFKVLDTFKRLLQKYKNTMVYVWYHPHIGLWLGATPENLLKVNQNTFTTMALAGTQVYQGSLDVVWEAKERQEQQFVTDFIVDALGKQVVLSKTKTVKAGSLLHLCTSISGELRAKFSLAKLLEILHPTPAVCGLPMAAAKRFILENESYNREYYTGFLGEMNIDNTSNIFVNLRCMQVLERQVAIYIGGGITVASIPENEWIETIAKSEVMLRML